MNGDIQNILPARSCPESSDSPSLDCAVLPLVSAYHDGELDESRARKVTEHLTSCSACSEALKGFQRLSAQFGSASLPTLTNENRHDLQLIAHDGRTGSAGRIGADVRWVRRLTAAAAILFLFAMGRIAYQHTHPQTPGAAAPAIEHHPVPSTSSSTPAAFSR